MQNIRKIIEERLENARLDLKCNINLSVEDVRVLQGQIEAYQDCLNLMQPRTEQEILKDFEKLGYFIKKETSFITLTNEYDDVIFIDLKDKCYDKSHYLHVVSITIQEHKLLNELFEVWGW